MRIRLSQPPAGDWLAGAWAELGNIWLNAAKCAVKCVRKKWSLSFRTNFLIFWAIFNFLGRLNFCAHPFGPSLDAYGPLKLCLSVCLTVCVCVCLFVYLCVCLYVSLSLTHNVTLHSLSSMLPAMCRGCDESQ